VYVCIEATKCLAVRIDEKIDDDDDDGMSSQKPMTMQIQGNWLNGTAMIHTNIEIQ